MPVRREKNTSEKERGRRPSLDDIVACLHPHLLIGSQLRGRRRRLGQIDGDPVDWFRLILAILQHASYHWEENER